MENLYFFDERYTEIELTGMKDKSRKETIIIPIPDDWHLVEDNGSDSSMKYIVPDSVEYDDDEVVAGILSGKIRTLIAIGTSLCDLLEDSDYSKTTMPADVCILYDYKLRGFDSLLNQFWLPSQDNAIMEIEEDDDEEYSCVSSGIIFRENIAMGRGGFLRIGSGFCAFRFLLDTSDELIFDEDDYLSTKQEAFENVREWIKETVKANSSSDEIHHCETMFVSNSYPLVPEMEQGIYYKKDNGMEDEVHMSKTDWNVLTRRKQFEEFVKTTAKGSPTKKISKTVKTPRNERDDDSSKQENGSHEMEKADQKETNVESNVPDLRETLNNLNGDEKAEVKHISDHVKEVEVHKIEDLRAYLENFEIDETEENARIRSLKNLVKRYSIIRKATPRNQIIEQFASSGEFGENNEDVIQKVLEIEVRADFLKSLSDHAKGIYFSDLQKRLLNAKPEEVEVKMACDKLNMTFRQGCKWVIYCPDFDDELPACCQTYVFTREEWIDFCCGYNGDEQFLEFDIMSGEYYIHPFYVSSTLRPKESKAIADYIWDYMNAKDGRLLIECLEDDM